MLSFPHLKVLIQNKIDHHHQLNNLFQTKYPGEIFRIN